MAAKKSKAIVPSAVVRAAPNAIRRCKAFGHQWDDAPAPPSTRARPPASGWEQIHFRCVRCSMIKRVRVRMSDGQTTNYYMKPENWDLWRHNPRVEWKIDYVLHVTRPSKPRRRKTK